MKQNRVQAQAEVQVENDRVKVTEWRFSPGAETGWHRHVCDYVVVPQTTGKLLLESKDGTQQASLQSGLSYYRNAGVEHNVININENEFVFVEIEMK
ncbi:MAG: cupin domain-containing protein [SAR324 cluster bacterium]|nr:cupin domain-containing protein [SAR324 cluster bacterium]